MGLKQIDPVFADELDQQNITAPSGRRNIPNKPLDLKIADKTICDSPVATPTPATTGTTAGVNFIELMK